MKTQFGFISFLTIILFLVLIAIFGWGIYYFRQPVDVETRQLQLPSPESSSTPLITKQYTNSNLGFGFYYPENWKPKEVLVQSSKILHVILELAPADYKGAIVPIKLLSVDNPGKLSLKDLDQKLFGKEDALVLYSVDDVYTLSGAGLAVNYRDVGECEKKPCQIYTFSREDKVYQLESFSGANIPNQKQIFTQIISSFKFEDFAKPEALGASVSASPRSVASPH